MSSDKKLIVSRIVALSVIPLVFLVSLILVLLRVVGVVISGVFGLLILVEGVVVGTLIALEKVELIVGILEAIEIVLQLVILGIIAHELELTIQMVLLEVLLGFFSYILVKVIKIDPQFSKLTCVAFILWLVLTVAVEKELLDSFVVTMLIDIVFNNIYQYYAGCNEIYYLCEFGESGFNKEYFDLYFNRNNIFVRVAYYLACISTLIYIKELKNLIDSFFPQYKDTPELVQLISSRMQDFGCTYIIFVILVLIVIGLAYRFILPKTIRKHFVNIEKLVATKKKNFGSYTESEKAIILE